MSVDSVALDEDRLWLPTYYERHYLALRSAALAAEELERCVKVLRGTVDLGQSVEDHLIFRIQCRQQNGFTYNEMVDGITFKTLTTEIVRKKMLSEEELDALRLEEERQRLEVLEAKKYAFFCACRDVFEEKTQVFMGREVLTPEPPAKEFTSESAVFVFKFDAKDVSGADLQYKAICSIEADEPPRLRIRKRRK